MTAHLSPQARRRLDNCLHGQERIDLAEEVCDALVEAYGGSVIGQLDDLFTVVIDAINGRERPQEPRMTTEDEEPAQLGRKDQP